jgi:predicted protein tyrosine phosphatase
MAFIENCAQYQIEEGKHSDAGENSVLIQICDPDSNHVKPLASFKEVYQFKFLDIEDENNPLSIKDKQAIEIVNILKKALAQNSNVIVNCVMGVCRSGAVADVGVTMGFKDCGKWRSPNTLVKQKLFKYVFGSIY